MNLTMHDVGFGDFFVLSENGDFCIVDCGSTQKSAIRHIATSALSTFVPRRRLQGIVTHFHEDHFNGYKELANSCGQIFDQIITPYVAIDRISRRPISIEMAAYFYTYLNSNTSTWQVLINLTQNDR